MEIQRRNSMNILVENGIIEEMMCGSNYSCILNDNSSFLTTEYKVLQSQTSGCFVKCMRVEYNGQYQLYYLTQSLKPLSSLIGLLDSESFIAIVANLLADIIEVKNNGFLSCQNVDASIDHIYVDPSTYKVSLIYLPINRNLFEDNGSFENGIRTGLIKLISGIEALSSPKTTQLMADLQNGMLSVEDIYNRVKGAKTPTGFLSNPAAQHAGAMSGNLKIIAMNAPIRIEIPITKDGFVIGKRSDSCDGVVGFNNKISRIHCRINYTGDQYTVTDLNSANGTYVNGTRLYPQQQMAIGNGDIIRMADSDFQVVIG